MNPLDQLAQNFDGLSYNTMTGDDLPGIDTLLPDVISEVKRLESAFETASEGVENLAEVKRTRAADFAIVQQKRNERSMAAIQETIFNCAADVNALGLSRVALERETELLQDSLDFLDFILCPSALDKKQEARRDLLRAQHLEAGLLAARSHCTMLQKLEAAGFAQSHGRVVAFSETTARLKLITAEAHRVAQAADAELSASRAARLARTQQRHADGMTTKAEAVFAAVELSRISTPESSTK
jgi:hypothetical protein